LVDLLELGLHDLFLRKVINWLFFFFKKKFFIILLFLPILLIAGVLIVKGDENESPFLDIKIIRIRYFLSASNP